MRTIKQETKEWAASLTRRTVDCAGVEVGRNREVGRPRAGAGEVGDGTVEEKSETAFDV